MEIRDGKSILMSTTAGSMLPTNFNTIMAVMKTDPISVAVKKMVSNQILSVPVYDRVKRGYTSFLDMLDIVAFALKSFHKASTDSQGKKEINKEKGKEKENEKEKTFTELPPELQDLLNTALFDTATCGEIADLSHRNPFFPVDSSAPLLEALHLMVKWRVHRIPVMDSEGELITVLSQSQITSHIYRYLWCFDSSLLKLTAASLAAGTKPSDPTDATSESKVVSVHVNDRAVDAFIAMHEKRVSGVAVLDENGKIVGNISASDLKAVGFDGALMKRLFYTVSEFMRLINKPITSMHAGSGPAVVHKDSSFNSVVGLLVNTKIHRVYVVDKEDHPIGVVGHGEILKAVESSFEGKHSITRAVSTYF